MKSKMIFHRIVIKVLVCLILTVLLEAAFAFLCGVRSGYGQLVVLLANVITNPLLNSILTVVSFYLSPSYYSIFLVLLEILVVAAEGLIYQKMELPVKWNPFVLSLLLNACSYFIGMGILKIIK